MGFTVEWILSKLRNPSRLWYFITSLTFAVIGVFDKVALVYLSKSTVYNKEILIKTLDDRPKGTPVITVSNHHSYIDDPGLWGVLRFDQICNQNVMRWTLSAYDKCFKKKLHSLFFIFSKCIPVVRGGGVYQPSIALCIEKLKIGEWVHLFPEGKINLTDDLRLKSGVGRMVLDVMVSSTPPIVIPIWHLGMDAVMPKDPPHYIRLGQTITINFGNPIDFTDVFATIKEKNMNKTDAQQLITAKIQEEMLVLRERTKQLHRKCF